MILHIIMTGLQHSTHFLFCSWLVFALSTWLTCNKYLNVKCNKIIIITGTRCWVCSNSNSSSRWTEARKWSSEKNAWGMSKPWKKLKLIQTIHYFGSSRVLDFISNRVNLRSNFRSQFWSKWNIMQKFVRLKTIGAVKKATFLPKFALSEISLLFFFLSKSP